MPESTNLNIHDLGNGICSTDKFAKFIFGMAQAVEYLLKKQIAGSSNPFIGINKSKGFRKAENDFCFGETYKFLQ